MNIVGSTFVSFVMGEKNADKDVFLYVYAAWCAHCKAFEPVLAEVSLALQKESKLVFARIDGSKNEIDHVSVRYVV